MAGEILAKLPPNFDLEYIAGKYPVTWAESMNTVLCQELERFNRLTSVIRESLTNVQVRAARTHLIAARVTVERAPYLAGAATALCFVEPPFSSLLPIDCSLCAPADRPLPHPSPTPFPLSSVPRLVCVHPPAARHPRLGGHVRGAGDGGHRPVFRTHPACVDDPVLPLTQAPVRVRGVTPPWCRGPLACNRLL